MILITWSNDRNESGYASGTTDWSVNNLTLQTGTSRFLVTISDIAGQTASAQLIVTYRPDLILSTVAGGGNLSPGDHGQARDAFLSAGSMVFDAAGNLFFTGANRIRKIDAQGI